MRELVGHLLRFGLVGAMTTGLAYVVFIGLIGLHAHYLLASAASWAIGILVSFNLNKRYTFGLRERASARQIGGYLGVYGLQLAIGSCGYAILIGRLGLTPTLAFMINLIATSTTSFLFMRLFVFRSGDVNPTPGYEQVAR